MSMRSRNTFDSYTTLKTDGRAFSYYALSKAAETLGDLSRLPFSLKILLENLLRGEDGSSVTADDIRHFVAAALGNGAAGEIPFRPARILMQDFSGTACLVDLAAMRDAFHTQGADPQEVNPLIPVHLVIDHSATVDYNGNAQAFADNLKLEYVRNRERYTFLRWGAEAFDNFSVIPPGVGICHQVNLEYLAQGVWQNSVSHMPPLVYPDTCIGTDSHTTMINGLGILGWGVGGIEAEAAMLGQPVSMRLPEVVGVHLSGVMPEGVTATDVVLTLTEVLRTQGVVGRFVEFCGHGLEALSVPDRATLANMAPEYGATCAYFPIDAQTIAYMRASGRTDETVDLLETYARLQGLWRDTSTPEPCFSETLHFDLSAIVPSVSGPRRPQDRVDLATVPDVFSQAFGAFKTVPVSGKDYDLEAGVVVIAAITSCTNTSNPALMIAAGLLAQKARARGLDCKPWVKTSLAPGSQVVTDYLTRSGLQTELDALGFNLVGYGCSTCVGNSGPLDPALSAAIQAYDLPVCAVLSGNRNFEGRISPDVRANFLASPPLVVAYALLGTTTKDIATAALGTDHAGCDVRLADIWPNGKEISEAMTGALDRSTFTQRYENIYAGDALWRDIDRAPGDLFNWQASSSNIIRPPFFDSFTLEETAPVDIDDAQPLAILGDSITTDHISPVGNIRTNSPAGRYLQAQGIPPADFNSYGTRRGNHEVMMRGTFANIRLRNEILPGTEGGFTLYNGGVTDIFDAAMAHRAAGLALVVIAGKAYGTGSARDWAAKGTALLGIRAVIAESFERIHRSNLVGMGVLPLQFLPGDTRLTLNLRGDDRISVRHLSDLKTQQIVMVEVRRKNGEIFTFEALCRIDTQDELAYYRCGGILPYVMRNLMTKRGRTNLKSKELSTQ